MSRRRAGGARCGAVALGLILLLDLVGGLPGSGQSPSGAGDPAPGRSATPGVLWGRIVVEEESPDGSWTPLAGVEVRLYPGAPALLRALERIRESARESSSQYETAVTRLKETLETSTDPGRVRKGVTDSTGSFVFDDVAPGEWVVVAVRVAAYASTPTQPAPRQPPARTRSGSEPRFLARDGIGPLKAADVWVVPVPVGEGERVRLLLTDRGRWMAGPVR